MIFPIARVVVLAAVLTVFARAGGAMVVRVLAAFALAAGVLAVFLAAIFDLAAVFFFGVAARFLTVGLLALGDNFLFSGFISFGCALGGTLPQTTGLKLSRDTARTQIIFRGLQKVASSF